MNFGYAYDPSMNMVRRTNTAAPVNYPVNALNQAPGGSYTYTYDRRENRIGSSNYVNKGQVV